MKKYLIDNFRVSLLLLIIFSILYTKLIIVLSSGLVINHYPFISNDGFDWITEGYWLTTRLVGFNVSDIVLPLARPPMFVFITALDSLAGQKGLIIAIALGLAMFGTGYIVLKSTGKNLSSILSIIILVALLLTPVNFVRKWILSDAIGVFLSLFAMYYLFENRNNLASPRRMIFLSILIVSTGVTQIYGVIGPLIGIVVLLIFALIERQFNLAKLLLTIGVLSIVFLALVSYVWYSFIPHYYTPSTFSLLRLSTGMFHFYLNTWGYYFLPFIPLLFGVLLININKILKNPFLFSLWISVIVFMFLAFCYQWKEARFTFIFWPFFIIAIYKTYDLIDKRYSKLKKMLLGISTTLIIFQSLFLNAGNEWQPNFHQINIGLQQTWVASMFLSKPMNDRFQLKEMCYELDRFCSAMIVDGDEYVRNVINAYLNIDNKTIP
jgi:hypothetical protein